VAGNDVTLTATDDNNGGSGTRGESGGSRTYVPAGPRVLTWEQIQDPATNATIEEMQMYLVSHGYGSVRDEFITVSAPLPELTLSDIASFAPGVGSQHMEPNGWIVTGLHTNFYSDAANSTVTGTLLGYAVAVRFTATAWRWDYGDGSSTTSATPGASWAALGLKEFDATATSHVFATPGAFTITLSVGFSAEYQFAGQPWKAIAGTLWADAPPLTAVSGDADTVLVARDCLVNPGGPGC
jgi:hypothetical protein